MFAVPAVWQAGARAVTTASSSPATSMSDNVLSAGIDCSSKGGGKAIGVRSPLPGLLRPPLRHLISCDFTPYSSERMPRAPKRCRHLIFRHADELAAQVLRGADASIGADIEGGVAKDAREKYR